jgi:transcriptional regulator with XRE-family HTH domain
MSAPAETPRQARPLPRLKRLRLAQKISRETIGHYLGVTSRTVHRWETGGSIPDRHKFALADMFGVSVPYLLAWDDDNPENGRDL